MTRRAAARGQIMPMVALLMLVIIGMAALAIDGSNIYSQHRRLQADLDVAIKVAAAHMTVTDTSSAAYTGTVTQAITSAAQLLAADGYTNTLTSAPVLSGGCASDPLAGITLCTPPTRGPFSCSQEPDCHRYVEGTLSRDVGGFFGGALGLGKLHISVRAVAGQGGHHQPYAMIGLDPAGCSIEVQDTSATLSITGSVVADWQSCNHGTAIVNGVADSVSPTAPSNPFVPIVGTEGSATVAPIPDPFNPISVTASAAAAPITVCQSGSGSIAAPCSGTSFNVSGTYLSSSSSSSAACATMLAQYLGAGATPSAGATYYFPPDTGSTPALISNFKVSGGAYYFLPHCDGSPAVYYFSRTQADMEVSGNSTVSISSFNSVFVLDTANNPLIKETGQAQWTLNAPTSGPYQGMAISAHPVDGWPPCPATHPAGPEELDLAGNAGSSIYGVLDAPCAQVTLTGNTNNTPFVDGTIVAYDIIVAGNGTTAITYDPSDTPAQYGSELVE